MLFKFSFSSLDWFVIGDFIEIVYLSDKLGVCDHFPAQMDLFCHSFNDCQLCKILLSDIYSLGIMGELVLQIFKSTWIEFLLQWRVDMFLNAHVRNLPLSICDHYAIFLSL